MVIKQDGIFKLNENIYNFFTISFQNIYNLRAEIFTKMGEAITAFSVPKYIFFVAN